MQRPGWRMLAMTGAAALAATTATAIGWSQSTPRAEAATAIRVSHEQLRINQRISHASVRRSNLALKLLAPIGGLNERSPRPGWAGNQIAAGAIGETQLSAEVRAKLDQQPESDGKSAWALVSADGKLLRGNGARSVERTTIPTGDEGPSIGAYIVTFDRDITECGIDAQPVAMFGFTGVAPADVSGNDGEPLPARSPEQVLVGTSSIDALFDESHTESGDMSFFLNVVC